MKREEFEDAVLEALQSLPAKFRERLENVDVLVEDWPSEEQIRVNHLRSRLEMLGLYQGVPVTKRYGYNMVLPDKITIFQKPIEGICRDRDETIKEIRNTVIHEIAHHFGIDDDRLDELGL